VFTPPNGNVKYFRFYQDASITDFEIAIYNRFGKRVYHFAGNIRDWDGWDGTIKGSNRVVQTGVYYYVVKEIRGLPDFDSHIVGDLTKEGEDNSKNTIHRGFVHVYNTE
jgi:gliding motility-associated-like protein